MAHRAAIAPRRFARRRLPLTRTSSTSHPYHLDNATLALNAGKHVLIEKPIVDHTQDLPDDPTHRINALELGGGALLDLGIYPISFAWDLFGKPETITAQATFKPTGADAQVATVFGYGDGRIATTLSASDTQGPNTACILGTKARIEVDAVWYEPTSFRVIGSDGSVLKTYESAVVGRGMQFQAQEAERLS